MTIDPDNPVVQLCADDMSAEAEGHADEAEECYHAAEAHFSALPDGPYADMVRDGVARGLERLRE